MAKFNEQHVFTGMQRDIDVSRHPASFLYDARNIRLTQRDGEGDTLYAITNEKGTELTELSIPGLYLGHALLNQYLTVFSKSFAMSNDANPKLDYITLIDLSLLSIQTLYNGDLGFDFYYPISAIGFYENEYLQKVYWVDGKNQPRFINIVGDIKPNLDTQFDFLPILSLKEKVYVTKQTSATGSFPPGVIQYMFTYYRKFGQESNIFYTTPLLYVSPLGRGGAPDEKVSNSFKINIKDIDLNFDYIRIYSLQRTSLNSTPIAKLVRDIAILTEIKKKQGTYWEPISDFVFSYGEPIVGVLRDNIFSPLNHVEEATSTTVGQFQLRFYKYLKAKYPDLCIRVYTTEKKPWYIRWHDSTDSSEVVYISEPYTRVEDNATVRVIGAVSEEGSHVWNENSLESLSSDNIEKDCLTEYTFIDTGVEGESVDPTELLYKQREAIIVNTLEQKDNTVFLGGIQYEHEAPPSLPANTITIASSNRTITFKEDNDRDTYIYYDQLNALDGNEEKNVPCGGFKRGEYYRLGVQFQDKFGKWSDPLYIDDVQETEWPAEFPASPSSEYSITLPTFTGTINSSYVNTLISMGYKKARAVVVFPDIQDREILCQGVTCPTVYRQRDISDSAIGEEGSIVNKQCQSSWFFRPIHSNDEYLISQYGATAPTYSGEIPTSAELVERVVDDPNNPIKEGTITTPPRRWEIQGYYSLSNRFRVSSNEDINIDTFHSPDVEYSTDVISQSFNSTMYKIVGYTEIVKTLSDIDIQTKSPTISNMGSGFDHHSLVTDGAKGIISGLFYDDYVVDEMSESNPPYFRDYDKEQSSVKWLVYPWHRSGSLNNDINRPANAGTRSAELLKKKISNLRYGKTTWIYSEPDPLDPTDDGSLGLQPFSNGKYPELFIDDSPSILKIGDTIYKGNVDTVLMPDLPDGYYFCFNDSITDSSIKAYAAAHPDDRYAIAYNLYVVLRDNRGTFTSPIVAANETEFTSESWWKTFAILDGQRSSTANVKGTVEVKTDFGNIFIQRKENASYINEGAEYEGKVGTSLILNVVPQNGYAVTYWRKGGSEGKILVSTHKKNSIKITVDYGINIYYAGLEYVGGSSGSTSMAHIYLVASPNNAGVVIGEGDYAIGSTATIRATPNSGYDFVAWKDSNNLEISTERSTSITVPSTGGLYTAYFEESGEKIVHFLFEGAGSIETDEETYTFDSDVEYAYGTIINLGATQEMLVTYFAYWTIDGVVVLEQDTTLQVTQEHRVKAVFPNLTSRSTQTYTLQGEGDISFEILGTSFEAALLNNGTTFPIGTELKLIATPQEGYRFANWSITDNGTTISSGLSPYNYTIEGSSCAITAVFESSQSTTRMVTFSEYPSAGGEIIANSVSYNDRNTATYTLGETIQLNVTPTYQTGLHYVFDYWLIDGELSRNQNTNLVIASNHSVKAYYKKDPSWAASQTYYLSGGQGSIKIGNTTIREDGDETYAERGTEYNMQAVPDSGYMFNKWIIQWLENGETQRVESNQATYHMRILVTTNYRIEAIFAAAPSGIKVYLISNVDNTSVQIGSSRMYVLERGTETAIDYTEGMTLQASNSSGTWKHWWRTSDDTRYSTSNPLTLTGLTADLHLSAIFN